MTLSGALLIPLRRFHAEIDALGITFIWKYCAQRTRHTNTKTTGRSAARAGAKLRLICAYFLKLASLALSSAATIELTGVATLTLAPSRGIAPFMLSTSAGRFAR